MDIEEIEIDGQLIVVHLPVNNMNISGRTVSYQDGGGSREQSFSTTSLARKFTLILAELK
ncbi:hypothetical protein [Alteromonas sp. ASW11-130]|uniref:hypothetical protein n=1 Tax=Alteromonas sp. ASW11-130 TaxID=3015775 RepID=UPI00224194BC|nr:hypothetical protein [Alteromonas sp. ASW11-130]MCW8092119.1 hypothetical protein [Alteromonas sp. ASW11-130]